MNEASQSPPRADGAADCRRPGRLRRPSLPPRPLAAAAGLLCSLLLSGCLPEERIWWALEGERALLRLGDGLRLVDGEGRTLAAAPESDGTMPFELRSVLWLPDGGIVWLEEGRHSSWDELRPLLAAEESAQVERLASALPGLASALLAFAADDAATPADPLSLEGLLAAVPGADRGARQAAFALSARRDAEAWQTLAARAPRLAPDLHRAIASPPDFRLHRLHEGRVEDLLRSKTPDRVAPPAQEGQVEDPRGFDEHAGSPGPRTLASGLDRLHPPKLSPCGGLLLWGRETESAAAGGGEVLRLELGALGEIGKSGEIGTRVLHEGAQAAYAWAPDGGSIYFFAPVWTAPSPLRQLKRLALAATDDPSGTPAAEPETLLVAVTPFLPLLSTLPDGRVLFAGQSLDFPIDPASAFEESAFFLHDPADRETRRVPTPPGALPTNLGHFVLCPAGERVAVVESDSDAVAVVTLATGEVALVSPPKRGWKCRTLPAWRNAGELSYAAAAPASGRVPWMRWSAASGASPLPGPAEESWPPERTAAWMDYREPTSQDPAQASER